MVGRSAIRQVDRIHQTSGSGPGASPKCSSAVLSMQ